MENENYMDIMIPVSPKDLEEIILGNKTLILSKKDFSIWPSIVYLYQKKDSSYKYKRLNNLKAGQGKVVGRAQYTGSVKMCSEFWNEPDTYEAIEVYYEVEDSDDDPMAFKIWNNECDDPETAYLNTKMAKSTCTTLKELKKWLGVGLHDFYGLAIEKPILFEKPRNIQEFLKPCCCPEMPYCPACKFGYEYMSEDEAEFYRMGEGAFTEWYCHNVVKNPPAPFTYCIYNPEGKV